MLSVLKVPIATGFGCYSLMVTMAKVSHSQNDLKIMQWN